VSNAIHQDYFLFDEKPHPTTQHEPTEHQESKREVIETRSVLRVLPWVLSAVLFAIICFQRWSHRANPHYIGIPIRGEGALEEQVEVSPEIEDKFQQMAKVLRYLVEEVREQKVALKEKRVRFEPKTLRANTSTGGRYEERRGFQTGVITAQRANVRAAPTLKSPSIMTLEQGTELLVEYEHNGWNRVMTPTGKRAWISSDVLRVRSDETYRNE